MKALIRLAVVITGSFFLLPIFASAGNLTIPNKFKANTPAVAAEVNANFTAVETEVDDNAADIAINTNNIDANTVNISTNEGDISGNAAAIGSLESLIVAYGKIASDATIYTGSNISSCVWNPTLDRYEITISGESYSFMNYATLITPVNITTGITCCSSSVSGKLLVYCTDVNGSKIQATFSFMTLKP